VRSCAAGRRHPLGLPSGSELPTRDASRDDRGRAPHSWPWPVSWAWAHRIKERRPALGFFTGSRSNWAVEENCCVG
jgi:hypothetical protein